jgi:AraC family transcriptional regulator, transcriptional activator of pobA
LDNPVIVSEASRVTSDPSTPEAPSFFLYGEAPRAAAPGFLHVEPLAVRSRPNGWTIRRHRHADLHHLFLMIGGGGRLAAEGGEQMFAAPCLLLIPAGAEHGFVFRRESVGQVLTVASAFLDARPACAEVCATLFQRVGVLECGEAAPALQDAFAGLARELGWAAPAHDAAVEAAVLQAFVIAVRAGRAGRAGPSREEALMARFRDLVELRFREHPPLQRLAEALGVSLSRLHHACRQTAGLTPLGVVQARLLLEAKRALLYSDMPVADLALSLGFEDPAYFSRFFVKHAGASPTAFRRRREAERVELEGSPASA